MHYRIGMSLFFAALAAVAATQPFAADSVERGPAAHVEKAGSSALPLESDKFEASDRALSSRKGTPNAGLRAARAHLEAGANDAAVASYRAAVARIQEEPDESETTMVAALTGLGTALLRSGEAIEGIATLERAVQVSRRTGGLFDPGQVEALETLADTRAQAGRFDVADSLYRYVVRIHAHQYGAEDARTAGAITTLATFKRGTGHYLDARTLYRRAISIIERDRGPSAFELIPPLAGLADVYRREALGLVDFEQVPTVTSPADEAAVQTRSELLSAGARKHAYTRRLHPAGLRYLNRALRIAQRRVDEVDSSTYHALLVQTGDWLLLARNSRKAMQQYARALSLESTSAMHANALEQVAPIYLALPSAATRHKWLPAQAVHETFAVIEFDVTATGTIDNARIVEGNASEADNRAAIRAFERSIYRPRFMAKEPVATPDVRHRLVFRKRR